MNQLDQYRQVQIFNCGEVAIDAPARAVWPYLLDFRTFNDTFEKIELLEGEEHAVGSITRLTKSQGQWYVPPYLVKIIHLEPGKRIVWKLFPEQGEEYVAFVEFSLREEGGKTIFAIRNCKDQRVSVRSPQELAAYVREANEATARRHREVNFPNIKRLCERHRTN